MAFEKEAIYLPASLRAVIREDAKVWDMSVSECIRAELSYLYGMVTLDERGKPIMAKGRNSSMVSIRLPDELVTELKKRAKKQGVPHTALIRHYLQEKCGLPLT
jgi:CopG antitoxin of type II toxin-antitoxin system